MPSKLYTNADLKPRTPLTITKEPPNGWSGPVSQKEIDSYGPSQDAVLADALGYMNREGLSTNSKRPTTENALALMSSPEGRDAARGQSDRAAIAAERSLGFPETIQRYAEPLKRGLDVGAGIGSMIPGPHQPFAGAYTALRGGEEFVEDPSASSAAWAGLGALPFLKPLRGAMNEAKVAKAAKAATEYERTGYGASGYAKNAQKARPSEGGYTPNSGKPSPGARPADNSNWAAGEVPAQPNPMQSGNAVGATNDLMSNQHGLDAMHAGYKANNPLFREMAQKGTFGERNIPASVEALAPKSSRAYGATEPGGWRDVSLDMTDDVIPTRAPMGASGNEYGGVQPYGPSTVMNAEESAAAPGFWDQFIEDYMGRAGR